MKGRDKAHGGGGDEPDAVDALEQKIDATIALADGSEKLAVRFEAIREIAFRSGAEASGILRELAVEDLLEIAGEFFGSAMAAVLGPNVQEGGGSAVVAFRGCLHEAEERASGCVADIFGRGVRSLGC